MEFIFENYPKLKANELFANIIKDLFKVSV